jgi:hypothetical protein
MVRFKVMMVVGLVDIMTVVTAMRIVVVVMIVFLVMVVLMVSVTSDGRSSDDIHGDTSDWNCTGGGYQGSADGDNNCMV